MKIGIVGKGGCTIVFRNSGLFIFWPAAALLRRFQENDNPYLSAFNT